MTLDDLRRAAALLPAGASLTLPREAVLALVAIAPASAVEAPSAADLTVEQTARAFGKAPSTIRTWLGRGEFPGAYRLHANEWRIPASAITSLQQTQAAVHRGGAQDDSSTARSDDDAPAELGAWRKHLPRRSA